MKSLSVEQLSIISGGCNHCVLLPGTRVGVMYTEECRSRCVASGANGFVSLHSQVPTSASFEQNGNNIRVCYIPRGLEREKCSNHPIEWC